MAAAKKLDMPNLELERILGVKRDPETGEILKTEKRPRAKTVAASRHGKTISETRGMIETGEWDGFAARHVVALYDLMHGKCYGVDPMTTSSDRYKMVLAAGAFVKRAFSGDFDAAVEYFRWLWDREIEREEWSRKNGKERARLVFWWTIGSRMVDDYRVAQARAKQRRG